MLHCFAEAVATAQRSSGGGCTQHHWRLLRSAAVAGTAAQCSSGGHRRAAQQRRPPRSGAACHKFQHAAPVRGPTIWRLKKMRGQGWPMGGAGGMGGPGREGESQVLNSIVVEALAGVSESGAKIECNLEFRIPRSNQ